MKKSLSLVSVKSDKPTTTSLAIAEGVGLEHKRVIALVRKYQRKLEEFAALTFETSKSRGLPTEFAVLDQDQATFLMTLFRNSDIVVEFKLRLVKEFRRALNEIRRLTDQRHTPEWQEQRLLGKSARKEVTDTIQDFVAYATAQGSKNAAMYYMSITKGTYAALFMLEHEGGWKGLRELLSSIQLNSLATAEHIASRSIRQSMDIDMYYRDIYAVAIDQVKKFAELVGKSTVPVESHLSLVKKDL